MLSLDKIVSKIYRMIIRKGYNKILDKDIGSNPP